MTNWTPRAVCVRVPATSANLGPGYDALGLALRRYDEVIAEITDFPLTIQVSGHGEAAAGAGEKHLVVRAMRAAFAAAGTGQPPGLALRCVNAIPQGRGLGSSAGAVVAGVLAARALATPEHTTPQPATPGAPTPAANPPAANPVPPGPGAPTPASNPPAANLPAPGPATPAEAAGVRFADAWALGLASELEGHPDNAAACLAGGLTIAWTPEGGDRPRAVRLEPVTGLTPVVCVPTFELATEQARRALPRAVPHRDAAASAGRAALLVAALTQAPELLFDATRDLLHEPYRAPLMPGTAKVIRLLREAGIPAVLSGAGPAVLALTMAGQTPGAAEVDSIVRQAGNEWHISPLDVDRQGAAIHPVPPGAHTLSSAR
ncbi:MAG TPA: homoserine kinase [Streptosporangiaceae bacterium]|jgi:homoserine kinase